MAVITFTISVSDIDSVLQDFDKIQVQRSEAGSPYTDAKFITAATITSPVLTGTTTAPFSVVGLTLKIKVNGGNEQTVTFTGVNPLSITDVVNKFNNTITGAVASDSSSQLKITGSTAGTGGTLEITGGTAITLLGFTTSSIDNGEDVHISLEENTSTYTYSDLSGETTYYYRTRFYNSTTSLYSSYSDWALGETTPQIGDEPDVDYTDEEIEGINILLKQLSSRLKNDVQVESLDENGNIEYVDCHVFSNEELVWFLECSLSEFNQTPHFTDFTFADQVIYQRFAHIIVEGATILAWAAQMVVEAGREFTITDNGITFNPPPLSGVLNNELSQFVSRHTEMLKHIKTSIKPQAVGFGGFRVLAVSPNYMRLRHLRQRRII